MASLFILGRLGYDDSGIPSVIETSGDAYPISDGNSLKVFEPWSMEMEIFIDHVKIIDRLPERVDPAWFTAGWLAELTKPYPM